MLKLCRVTKVKAGVFSGAGIRFLILANFKLFEFLATILEKGLFRPLVTGYRHDSYVNYMSFNGFLLRAVFTTYGKPPADFFLNLKILSLIQ